MSTRRHNVKRHADDQRRRNAGGRPRPVDNKARQIDPNNQDDEGDGDATQKTTTTEEGNHRDDDDDATRTTTTEEAGWGGARTLSHVMGGTRTATHDNTHNYIITF